MHPEEVRAQDTLDGVELGGGGRAVSGTITPLGVQAGGLFKTAAWRARGPAGAGQFLWVVRFLREHGFRFMTDGLHATNQ
jgi:hypothetical protein